MACEKIVAADPSIENPSLRTHRRISDRKKFTKKPATLITHLEATVAQHHTLYWCSTVELH